MVGFSLARTVPVVFALSAALALGCGGNEPEPEIRGPGGEGGTDGSGGTGGSGNTEVIGPEGGVVTAGQGITVTIPAGALASETTIGATVVEASGLPARPSGMTAVGPFVALTPHGTQFAIPVEAALPYTSSSSRLTVLRIDDESDTTWEQLAGASFEGGTATVEVAHFSILTVAATDTGGAGGSGGTGGSGGEGGLGGEAGNGGAGGVGGHAFIGCGTGGSAGVGTGGTGTGGGPTGCLLPNFSGEPDVLLFPRIEPQALNPGSTVDFTLFVDADTRLVKATLMDAWRLLDPPGNPPSSTAVQNTAEGCEQLEFAIPIETTGSYYVDLELCASSCDELRVVYTLNRANAGPGSDAINDPYERIVYEAGVETRSSLTCDNPDSIAIQE